jgi:hypothetical protein
VRQNDYEPAVAIPSGVLAIRPPAIAKESVFLCLSEVLAVLREDVIGEAKDMACVYLQAGLLGDSFNRTPPRRH